MVANHFREELEFTAVAVQPQSVSSQRAVRPQGPRSERDFIKVLRDHALGSIDVEGSNQVLGLTTVELEEETELSRTAISSLLTRFKPVLQGQDANGSPIGDTEAVRWTIDPDAGVVVGIELGPEAPPAVALSDLYGRIAGRVRTADHHPATADKALGWAVDTIRELLGGHAGTDIVGVGVSVAAPIERETGVIRAGIGSDVDDPRWTDWQLTRLREQINDRLGPNPAPVLLDNDANLNALAEYIWGAGRQSLPDLPSYQNVVYLEWSWGIGMGLILEGNLYRGSGIAGEIGHTIVRGRDKPDSAGQPEPDSAGQPEPDGTDDRDDLELCPRCYKKGCLEGVAGLKAILNQLDIQPLEASFSGEDLFVALGSVDSRKRAEVFEAAAVRMDRVLGPIIHLLNPQLVIIGGEIGRFAYETVKTPLLDALKDYTIRPALADVVVVGAKLREQPTLQGAISLMLRPTPGDPDALLSFLQRKSS